MKMNVLLLSMTLVISESAIAAMCPDGSYVSGNHQLLKGEAVLATKLLTPIVRMFFPSAF